MEWNMDNKKLERKIEKLKTGDLKAFDYVYDYTNRIVYFSILKIMKDKTYAEDILQDTFIRAMSCLSQYKKDTNFIGWICAIGKSLAINHLKKFRHEVNVDFDLETYDYNPNENELPYIFDIATKILSEDEYKIIMLCHVSGYKRREVSMMLDMPIGTVTWKNNEALKKLKQYLEKEDIK
jgi:RNA polymerase sigma-70 factor (ECF subfamily)